MVGVLPSLSKVVGSDLAARPNVVVSGYQVRPKTLLKSVKKRVRYGLGLPK